MPRPHLATSRSRVGRAMVLAVLLAGSVVGCPQTTADSTASCATVGDPTTCLEGSACFGKALAAGGKHACAVVGATGEVRCWGRNEAGQVAGTPTPRATNTATFVAFNKAIVKDVAPTEIEAAGDKSCALFGSVVQCWGQGRAAITNVGLSGAAGAAVSRLDMSATHSCVIEAPDATSKGTPACWDRWNDGSPDTTYFADALTRLPDTVEVAAGTGFTCVRRGETLDKPGAVRCFGANDKGQLGLGRRDNDKHPLCQVDPAIAPEKLNVSAVAAGTGHVCAIQLGTPYCWGDGASGQLGRGSTDSDSSASPAGDVGTFNVVELSGSDSTVCIRRASSAETGGTVWCWGRGRTGEFGDPAGPYLKDRLMPEYIGAELDGVWQGIDDGVEISMGASAGCVRRGQDRELGAELWCWGRAFKGEFTPASAQLATRIGDFADVVEVSVGTSGYCFRRGQSRTGEGTVWCAGSNQVGQLGIGSIDPLDHGPTQVLYLDGSTEKPLNDAVEVDAFRGGACARRKDGTVWCWGGPRGAYATKLEGLSDVVQVATGPTHACARTSSKGVWCWGDAYGGLGDGKSESSATPVEVKDSNGSSLSDAVGITAGESYSCVVRPEGTSGRVYCWGQNASGQLGRAPGAPVKQPQDTVLLCPADRVACPGTCTATVKGVLPRTPNDDANCGACGNACVGGAICVNGTCCTEDTCKLDCERGSRGPSLDNAVELAAGSDFACVRLAASRSAPGKVQCWGNSESGRLGREVTSAADAYAPADVSKFEASEQVVQLALGARHACVRAQDGSVWCWGANDQGQLGVTGVSRTAPVRVSGGESGALLTDVVDLTAGDDFTCARFASGAIRCWGANDEGQLGDHSNKPSVSPAHNVRCCASGVAACESGCADLKTDVKNCGTCGNACSTNFLCVDGKCSACPAPSTVCGTACVTLSQDPVNCGKCGSACGEGQLCLNGACVTDTLCVKCLKSACGPSLVACGKDSTCIDWMRCRTTARTAAERSKCGAPVGEASQALDRCEITSCSATCDRYPWCANTCTADEGCPSGAGKCSDVGGAKFCLKVCETPTDCASGYTCSGGVCTPDSGQCASCADTDGDGYGVGNCLGVDCAPGDAAVYPTARELCDGKDNDCDELIDEDFKLDSDAFNCSACGMTCQSGPCIGGACQACGQLNQPCCVVTPSSADDATVHDECVLPNVCTNGTCQPVPQCQGKKDGTPCNDDNGCTTTECSNGACVVKSSKVCPATANTCLDWECDPTSGVCLSSPNSDASCDDGYACTANDKCLAGVCTPGAALNCDDGNACTIDGCGHNIGCYSYPLVSCDDSNPCTTDACNTTTGLCEHGPLDDGQACKDATACTMGESCQGGVCTPGAGTYCDSCTTAADCKDDANLCNGTPVCKLGLCVNEPTAAVKCTAIDACHVAGECDPITGKCTNPVAPNGVSCDDGQSCTTGDLCSDGQCVGFDYTACPKCVDSLDCLDDNDLCNGVPICSDGRCVISPATVTKCAAPGPCKTAACNKDTGQCEVETAVNGTPCDDGQACSTGDACQSGFCTPASTAACGCTADSQCPDDGNLCNGTPACIAGKCVSSSISKVCDALPCHEAGTCTPVTGLCTVGKALDAGPCDDGDACTSDDGCVQGSCIGAPVACDDVVSCTKDACDPVIGCTHTAVDAACDDSNPCTVDVCNVASGSCTNTPVAGAPCEDGNKCTSNDSCNEAGACVSGAPIVCTSDEACHIGGVCDPLIGCPPAPDGSACDDGDACTQTDTCQGGQCDGSNPVVCEVPECHEAVCQPSSGACVDGVVADGAPCTGGACIGGTCVLPLCDDEVKNGTETGIDCGGSCPPCPTCTDGAQNGSETGIDCGGSCPACPTCTDGVKNGNETGTDCGGSCSACPTCTDGKKNGTETGVDCGGSCSACPTCTDGVKNGTETGVDCGGSCAACPTCTDGVKNGTETGIDCGGSCVACPTCTDGVKNGTETGVDCGGSCAACPTLTTCQKFLNCVADCDPLEAGPYNSCAGSSPVGCFGFYGISLGDSKVIGLVQCVGINSGGNGCPAHTPGLSTASSCYDVYCPIEYAQCAGLPVPSCTDGKKNGNETGIDCGGSCSACPTCTDGKKNGTETGVDCGGSCSACPTCTDNTKNGTETGIDCGGSCPACPPSCTDGAQNGTETGIDCGGPCPTCPTCTDGVKNGSESGVDCGGPCPACPTCNDGAQNGTETGIDCGGSCPACPTCDDGVQNGTEEGIDCGGSCGVTCLSECERYLTCMSGCDFAIGQPVFWGFCTFACDQGVLKEQNTLSLNSCVKSSGCAGFATFDSCAPTACPSEYAACGPPALPSCTDGVQNGTESGIDCGGTCSACPVCGDGWVGIREECDDGEKLPNDGCSADCKIEAGYQCETPLPIQTAVTDDGEQVAQGQVDPHWSFSTSLDGPWQPALVATNCAPWAWQFTLSTGCQWINQKGADDNGCPASPDGQLTYYRATFVLTAGQAGNIRVSGQVWADDSIEGIYVNSVSTDIAGGNYATPNPLPPLDPTLLVEGTNTLIIAVRNVDCSGCELNPDGLLLCTDTTTSICSPL
jgi:alpha-tubulin suppressor-like RCC1 family protein